MVDIATDRFLQKYQQPDFVCAYGSGAFRQRGYKEDEKPMVDFIFGVRDVDKWHTHNMKDNPQEYSSISKMIGVHYLPGAPVYYNPYIDFEGRQIKIGVTSTQELITDLEEWSSFYLSGRLQKPVEVISSNERVNSAYKKNLHHAFHAALLLLPESFSRTDLFTKIASLSYAGDIRMGIAENDNKITNIVEANLPLFESLYEEEIVFDRRLSFDGTNFTQDKSQGVREARSYQLPKNFLREIKRNHSNEPLERGLTSELSKRVWRSSVAQGMQGIISGGLRRVFPYVYQKIKKKWTSHSKHA